jgi:hypothetical protein
MFPRWMYNPTEGARIVSNPDEAEALGEDWSETPFHLESPHNPPVAAEEAPTPATRKKKPA